MGTAAGSGTRSWNNRLAPISTVAASSSQRPDSFSRASSAARKLGLRAPALVSTGARSPNFRAALLELEKESGLWLEHAATVGIGANRLFHVRVPLPAAVPTGDYRVEVLLVRSRRIHARQEMEFRVDRVGVADRIATVARAQPLVYGAVCVLLAAFAGWFGSVLFRRG